MSVIPINSTAVREEALTWPNRARAAAITDVVSYTLACEMLKGIKLLRGRIAETFDSHIKRAFDAHRALCKEKQDAEAPLTDAERILKTALAAWDTEQEQMRREEERRLSELARQQEESRRLEEAAALERDGQGEHAAALIEEPITAPAVYVPPSTPKVAGISFRETWAARVVSLPKLVAFVAAHPQHANLLTANVAALNALARGLKGGMRVDGVEAVCTKTTAAGVR